jgi:hypothetical protein
MTLKTRTSTSGRVRVAYRYSRTQRGIRPRATEIEGGKTQAGQTCYGIGALKLEVSTRACFCENIPRMNVSD